MQRNLKKNKNKKICAENTLVVQWLGLSVSPTWGSSLIPGWGTKSPQASQCGKKKKDMCTQSSLQDYLQ